MYPLHLLWLPPPHMNSRYCSCLYLHLPHPTEFSNLKPWMDLLKVKVVTSPVIKSSLHSTAHKKVFSIQSCLTLQLCLPLITISHIPLCSLRTHSVGVPVPFAPFTHSSCHASLINSWQWIKICFGITLPTAHQQWVISCSVLPLYAVHTSPLKL